MSKVNIALAKLAIGIVSVGAIAGIAGRFSEASEQAEAEAAAPAPETSSSKGGTSTDGSVQRPRLAAPQQQAQPSSPGTSTQARRTRTKHS